MSSSQLSFKPLVATPQQAGIGDIERLDFQAFSHGAQKSWPRVTIDEAAATAEARRSHASTTLRMMQIFSPSAGVLAMNASIFIGRCKTAMMRSRKSRNDASDQTW
jgi:hypothetical protein